ncbi:hypothetical protein J14TS2_00290 [Bacillus sp. J14TS2]|uniref:ankyrin repeat domain-containing protein n=1 Tax=Bacillus sp. J14TS2 TaxID=2807188 RepID=UPI001B28C65D|nr:ankyrin repeat domain-containing protein [Bacillus sp. J14TS2]GIN69554.1 hypothetical protein J14TS2_00290 [Bacillus sp. J14TS2]
MNFKHINRLFIFLMFILIMAACQDQDRTVLTNVDKEEKSGEEQTAEIIDEDTLSPEETNENEEVAQEVKNETSHFEDGSLLKAVEEDDQELVLSILENSDYQVEEMNDNSETPLMLAVHNNFIEISKMLIDHGADINKQDEISDSPYLYAGAQGRSEILKYMLENATPNEKIFNRFGGNALIPAAEKGHLENVKLLLEKSKIDINHQNNYGYTALIEAVALAYGSRTYQDIIRILLENGANPNLKDHHGKTALDYAQELNYVEMKNILKEYN